MTTIFHRETNAQEEWLEVNADGSLTHHIENSGWVATRNGLQPREQKYTADEAKAKWVSYADKIDAAILKTAN